MTNTRDEVDGLKVITRQPAVIPTPVGNGKRSETIEELLLENEAIVFMCNHKLADGQCVYVADNAQSVLSHMRTHAAKHIKKRAEDEVAKAKAETAKAVAELAERRQAASDRAKKAAATRNANKVSNGGAGADNADELEQGIIAALDTLELVSHTLESAIRDLDAAAANLKRDIETLKKRKTVPAEIVEKAQKYDSLKGLFN
jgi:hypothetical protein